MKIIDYIEIEKSGTLRFWGNWFGKPYDNFHHVVHVDFDTETNSLILYFDMGEICIIENPDGIVNNAHTFRIHKASSITWQWYSYGYIPRPEMICMETYLYIDSNTVQMSREGNLDRESKTIDPQNYNALEIV